MKRFAQFIALALVALACNEPLEPPPPPPPEIKVTVSPKEIDLVVSATQQFAAWVTGTKDRTVSWYINDLPTGNSTVGTIDTSGLYTAPEVAPNPAVITIKAVSRADPVKSATATATVIGPTDQPLLVWTTFFPPSPPADNGYLSGVTLDKDENVVATGPTWRGSACQSPPCRRAIVVSTDRFGRHRWIYTSDGITGAEGIILAPDLKSVFITGAVGEYPQQLPLLFAIDSTGHKQFERVCSNMLNGWLGKPTGDSSHIYIPAWPPAIVTSDLAGNVDCTNTINAAVGGMLSPRVSAVSPLSGALVVAGDRSITNKCWHPGLYPFLQKVNGTSQPVWRFDFESIFAPTNTSGSGPIITLAQENNQEVFYFATSWIESPEECVMTTNDFARYLTAKLDAQGNLVWFRLWNGDNTPTSCEAYPYAVIPNPHGGVIIAGMGSTDCKTAWDCAVASYSADGSLQWTMKPVFKGNGNNACSAATMRSDGRFLYLVGQTGPVFHGPQKLFVAKYALP